MRRTGFLFGIVLLVGTRALAQSDPNGPDPSKVKLRFGPLQMNPTITIGNAGTDTNVFNDASDPKRDFTFTISPNTDLWLPLAGTWFKAAINEDIVWYQKYASERSANSTYAIEWRIPLPRLTLVAGARHVSTRSRPGFEIDERALRSINSYSGSASFRFLSKTSLEVSVRREKTIYDENATFQTISLHDELDRTTTIETVGISHKLTPLTTVAINLNLEQDRFFNRLRDTKSTEAAATVVFDPLALVKGTVTVGYRWFTPLSQDVPAYRGSTVSAALTYALFGLTRFSLKAGRDVQFSYDINQPYYVQTGISGEITQQLFGPVDVAARGGVQRLSYRDGSGVAVERSDRIDRIETYGGGLGIHLGRDLRFGLNADQNRRRSVVDLRSYSGVAFGGALTYDF